MAPASLPLIIELNETRYIENTRNASNIKHSIARSKGSVLKEMMPSYDALDNTVDHVDRFSTWQYEIEHTLPVRYVLEASPNHLPSHGIPNDVKLGT